MGTGRRSGRRAGALALVLALGVAGAPPAGAPGASSFGYRALAVQPHSVSEAQGLVVGDVLYSVGGFDSTKPCCTPTDRAYALSIGSGRWRRLADLPGRGMTHAGLTTDGTDIYYAGGYVADAEWDGQIFGTREVWRYDVSADDYERLPDLPLDRAGGQLEYLHGRLHYFGGTNRERTADVSDHWSLRPDRPEQGWRKRRPLPDGRHHLGSAVLGDRIWAVGGQHRHDSRLSTRTTVSIYDPVTNRWAPGPSLPQGRGHISNSTFVLDGRLVVAGGEISHGNRIASVIALEPGAGGWTPLTPLPAAKASGVADRFRRGFVYTGGGGSGGWRARPAS